MATVDLSEIDWEYCSTEGRSWLDKLGDAEAAGDVVRTTESRTVLHGDGVYVKEIRYEGPRRLLKALSGGNACREGQMSRKLLSLGIAVPEVLAYGRESRHGLLVRDVLITREVSRSQRLYDQIFQVYPGLPAGEKRVFIDRFATYINELHAQGVQHGDLHIGNILVQGELTSPEFVLLDTDQVKLRRGVLNERQRAKNLGLLLTNFQKLTTRSERFRFLKSYTLGQTMPRQLASLVEKYSLQVSLKIWHKRARASLGKGRNYACWRADEFQVWSYSYESSGKLSEIILPNPDQELQKAQVIKNGRTVRAGKIVASGESWFLKRFNDKGLWYRFRNAFRRSRALRTWINSWEFWQRGLPIPTPLVCIERRRWRCLHQSYIAYEFVDESRRLTEIWPGLTKQQGRSLLVRIALMLGHMHRTGCLHGDLKWNNLLIDAEGGLHLVDLDGSVVNSRSSKRFREKDIGRFQADMRRYRVDEETSKLFTTVWQRWSKPMSAV